MFVLAAALVVVVILAFMVRLVGVLVVCKLYSDTIYSYYFFLEHQHIFSFSPVFYNPRDFSTLSFARLQNSSRSSLHITAANFNTTSATSSTAPNVMVSGSGLALDRGRVNMREKRRAKDVKDLLDDM